MEQYLIFNVSNEKYALNINNVREVIDYRKPEEVPNVESHVLGMLSIRQEIIAIMDSTVILNTHIENIHNPLNKIVIFESDGNHIGLIVESVSEVIEIDESQIDPPPLLEMDEKIKETYVRGVTTHTGKLIIIIDTTKTMLDKENYA